MLAPRRADESEGRVRRRHHTWNTGQLRAISWKDLVLRDAAAWALTAMLVTGVLAVAVDIPYLLSRGAGTGTALATGLFAAGLAAGLAAPLALLLVGLAALVRWIWLRWGQRWAAFAPVALISLAVAWAIARPGSGQVAGRLALMTAFVSAIVGLVAAGRARRPAVRLFAAVVLGALALAVDLTVPKSFYREAHDLACLVTIMAAMVVARPLQRRAVDVPAVRLVVALLCGLALSAALMTTVDQLAPGWRRASAANSRYASRLLSLTRTVVDLDADGFSPIGWGGDCDDLDGRRGPMMRDQPGAGDRNCNGIDPPAQPTDKQRGLAPPRGDPDLPPGAADLVLLVTIDCLRADTLTATAMPRLAEHGARGVTFERMYAAGTRTATALPLMATGGDGKPLGAKLRAGGVASTLILGVDYPALVEGVGAGMEVLVDREQRWTNAVDVTARTLAHLRRTAGARRRFVWVHYFDAHTPSAETLPPTTAAGVKAARDYYLAGLDRVDHELGELLDTLARRKALDRAVVIVTGDHGEAFGEHGVFFHNVSGYEPVVRVPALLLAPGLRPGVHRALASQRDIHATVLGAFGLAGKDVQAERFGRSWLRLRGAPEAPLHTFVTIRTHRYTSGPIAFSPMLAIVRGHHKLVKALDEDNLYELYDLAGDPGETVDLSWKDVALRESLERDLDTYRDVDRWP